MTSLDVVVFVIAGVVHAVSVTTQAGLIASVPSRLAQRTADGSRSLGRFADDPHGALLGLQTLNALTSVALGAAVADRWWAVAVGAAVLVLTSVAVPLRAVPSPENTVAALAPFVGPFVAAVAPLSTLVGKVAGRRRTAASVDGDELGDILDQSRDIGLIDDDDHELIAAVLQFERRNAVAVMVPMDDIVVVGRSDTVAEAERAIAESGHSRLLVVGERPGDVLGFVHAKDLMALPDARRHRPIPFDVIRMVLVANPTTSLGDVFSSMRRARRHVVVITDPDEGTVGMVTMEDILEVIVGDIVDESDAERGHVPTD